MRVNPRLLGLALGLSRPSFPLVQRLNRALPSPLLLRQSSCSFSSPLDDFDESDPADSRLAKDVEREENAQKFADESVFFPKHPNFTPSKALEGERDLHFPPDFSSRSPPTPRTTNWPTTPPTTTAVVGSKALKDIHNYRQAYKAFFAIEKTVLEAAYGREDIIHGEGERYRAQAHKAYRLELAQEEEAAVERLRQSPDSNELVPRRILAAVPWTTSRFRMSNALVADAFVEYRGVDITRGEGQGQEEEVVGVDPETGLTVEGKKEWEREMKEMFKKKMNKKEWEKEMKKKTTALKIAHTKKKNKAVAKDVEHQTWLSLVFNDLPIDQVRLEDWNAAIRYYRDLEVEVREAQALEFKREYRKRANMGTAEADALKGIAEPGDHYSRLERELEERDREREPLSLDRFL